MADYITLLGSESVSQAARNMQSSATRIWSAAESIECSAILIERALRSHNVDFDASIDRLVEALNQLKNAQK